MTAPHGHVSESPEYQQQQQSVQQLKFEKTRKEQGKQTRNNHNNKHNKKKNHYNNNLYTTNATRKTNIDGDTMVYRNESDDREKPGQKETIGNKKNNKYNNSNNNNYNDDEKGERLGDHDFKEVETRPYALQRERRAKKQNRKEQNIYENVILESIMSDNLDRFQINFPRLLNIGWVGNEKKNDDFGTGDDSNFNYKIFKTYKRIFFDCVRFGAYRILCYVISLVECNDPKGVLIQNLLMSTNDSGDRNSLLIESMSGLSDVDQKRQLQIEKRESSLYLVFRTMVRHLSRQDLLKMVEYKNKQKLDIINVLNKRYGQDCPFVKIFAIYIPSMCCIEI